MELELRKVVLFICIPRVFLMRFTSMASCKLTVWVCTGVLFKFRTRILKNRRIKL